MSSACERAAKRLPQVARDSIYRTRMPNSPLLGNLYGLGRRVKRRWLHVSDPVQIRELGHVVLARGALTVAIQER